MYICTKLNTKHVLNDQLFGEKGGKKCKFTLTFKSAFNATFQFVYTMRNTTLNPAYTLGRYIKQKVQREQAAYRISQRCRDQYNHPLPLKRTQRKHKNHKTKRTLHWTKNLTYGWESTHGGMVLQGRSQTKPRKEDRRKDHKIALMSTYCCLRVLT